jgi:hypothetical protein
MQIKNLVWFGHFSNVLLVKYTGVRKRAFSGSVIPYTLLETQEVDFFSEITNSNIVRACKRALSGQQTQADSLTRITKQRQTQSVSVTVFPISVSVLMFVLI